MLPVGAFWFVYFGGLGIFFPYYSLYLKENAGLSASQVGIVLAILPAVGILAQPFWGQVADRTGLRTRVLALLCLGAAGGQLLLGEARGFGALAAATALLALFHTSVIPISVAVSLGLLRDRGREAFGVVRAWGTIGFLVLVVSFPVVLHRVQAGRGLARGPEGPSEPGLELMFPAIAVLYGLAALLAFLVPRSEGVVVRAPRGDWRRLVRHGPYLRLLLFVLGAYLFLQGPITLFPVFVRSRGGDMETVSRMWILMLLLEIPLVALSGMSLERIGARGLLVLGALAGGVRWAVCGLSVGLDAVYASSLLHGIVVAGLLVGAALYVDQAVPERLRATGQAALAMLGIGLGGIASNVATGWLIDRFGNDAPYLAGGCGGLLLAALLPWWLPPPSRPEPAPDES